ncbi:hypothetical protein E1295_30365 [Nonomuraea mesophila]|uniref:Uncharacterized protein n=1 Tax=Nonomuraea mesophila TaxID=2530382 RepID=A0A4R5F1J0_9ACTN|nr:hypothetical protein [Nonomuraea mesophila]TDE41388.1 hypothetical protein E1295_30365 [Nonomuraea mesophila]
MICGKKLVVLKAILVVAVAQALAVTVVAQPAQAARWRDIDGKVWSSAGKWYNSKTIRKKAGKGNIAAKFAKLPSRGAFKKGMFFGVKSAKGRYWMSGSIPAFYKEGEKRVLATGVKNGKKFFTSFKRRSHCKASVLCRHSFEGQMRY